jgi:hypothetical protein
MIIKSFKIFEWTFSQLHTEVDSFLYPFLDEGYKINNRLNGGGGISIWVDNHPFEKFYGEKYSFSSISDDFLRLIEFLLNSVNKVRINVDGPIAVRSPICLGIIIHRDQKDWEERILKEIRLDTKIQAILIEI